ncbi:MAG: MFS transporter [Reyranellaceae bacterium]
MSLASQPPLVPHPWRLVWLLSVGQLVSWGAFYYGFSLFVEPMERELGWSRTELTLALSGGLLVAGFSGVLVGDWIDKRGGFWPMTLGSIVGAALLVVWSQVDSLPVFFGLWLLLGGVQACTLYDPAFAVITANLGGQYRLGITCMTLVGGFASTIFMPATQVFIDWWGWREALLALAGLNLAVGLFIHAWLLRGTQGSLARRTPEERTAGPSPLRLALRRPVFWLLSLSLVCQGAAVLSITFHIVPLLGERGLSTRLVLLAIALIGPAQVAGRLVLLTLGRHATTSVLGSVTVALLPLSMLALLQVEGNSIWLYVFVTLYGAGNGLMTIVRGASVVEFLGAAGFGAVTGALGLPTTIARTLAPPLIALLWEWRGNYDLAIWLVGALGLVGAVAYWLAAATARRDR